MTLAEHLTRFSLRHPAFTLGTLALATLVLASGIPKVQRETSLRTFLGPDNPTVLTLDRHIERFGGGYPIIIAYSCDDSPCESIFDPPALTMASGVARHLAVETGIRAVHTPANTPLLLNRDGDIFAANLTEEDGAAAVLEGDIVEAALSDPLWQRALISSNGQVGAIVVEVASTSSEVQSAVAHSIESALDPYRGQGWNYRMVGELVDFVYSGPDLERASQAMVPAMVVVLIVVLVLLMRSIALALAVVTTMGIAFTWTQGAMGVVGIKLNALTTVTPSLVFAIGILDGVHVVSRFTRRIWREGEQSKEARIDAIVRTTNDVGSACLLTSITTIGAFLAFLASGIASFAEFALAAAWGISCAFVLTFTALPMILVRLPVRWMGLPRAQPSWEGFFDDLLGFVHRHTSAIVLGSILVTIFGIAGVAQVRIEIHPEQLIGETSQVMTWNRWVRENLRETETLEVALSLPPTRSFKDPEVLREIDRIAEWMAARDELRAPRSVLDGLRHLNRLLHGGDEAYARYEAQRSSNAQLATLISINDPSWLDQWVYTSGSRGDVTPVEILRIAAEATSLTTAEQEALLREVRAHLAQDLPEGWSFELTGSIPMYFDMMMALQRYQLICFGIAGLVAFALMAVLLRSARASLIATIPSVVPIVGIIGLLGWWGYGLDPGSTMVGTIVLGVAVDDGIHLLSRYRRARELGVAAESAADESVQSVGAAVVASSLVLAAAFWSLTASPTSSVATFGFLAGFAVLAALVADLLLLPALLIRRTFGDPYPNPRPRTLDAERSQELSG